MGADKSARAVGAAGVALVAASLIGGRLSRGRSERLVHGLDEPSYAGRALANASDTGVRDRGCGSVTALAGHHRSAVLGLSAALSGIYGFFDGQLARSDLDGVYVMAQVSYVVVAGLVVAAAIGRIWAIQRGRVHSSVSDVRM